MKTTIALATVLLAGGLIAPAEGAATLVAGVDFNTDPGTTDPGADLSESLDIGLSEVAKVAAYVPGVDSGSYTFAYTAEDKVGTGGGSSYSNAKNSARVELRNLGVNTETGFTIAINAKAVESSESTQVLFYFSLPTELKYGMVIFRQSKNQYSLTIDNGTAFPMDGEEEDLECGAANATSIPVDPNTWYNIFLTVQGGSMTLTAMTMDGEVLDDTVTKTTSSVLGGEGVLDSVNLGFTTSHYDTDTPTPVDNFGVYDSALTTAEMQDVTLYEATNSTMAKTTPEPTTATLSLLALAGLAARRRRK